MATSKILNAWDEVEKNCALIINQRAKDQAK